jgi:hypothetical protein
LLAMIVVCKYNWKHQCTSQPENGGEIYMRSRH